MTNFRKFKYEIMLSGCTVATVESLHSDIAAKMVNLCLDHHSEKEVKEWLLEISVDNGAPYYFTYGDYKIFNVL